MLHIGLDYLDRLPASAVPAYAVSALERDAQETLRWLSLFQIPVEAWGGGRARPLFSSLRDEALWRLGMGSNGDTRSEEERAAERKAIAEVEAEIARDWPIYLDEEQLTKTHQELVLRG